MWIISRHLHSSAKLFIIFTGCLGCVSQHYVILKKLHINVFDMLSQVGEQINVNRKLVYKLECAKHHSVFCSFACFKDWEISKKGEHRTEGKVNTEFQ